MTQNESILAIVVIAGLMATTFSNLSFADRPGAGWNPGPSCSPEDLCQKHEEIKQEAVNLQDPMICHNLKRRIYRQDYGVSPRQQQEECKVHYAVETGDVNYCKSLKQEPDQPGNRPWRDVCLSRLARRLRRPGLCDDIYGLGKGEEREYYQESCLVQTSYSLDQCETYKGKVIKYYGVPQNFYDWCVRSVAENTNQPKICDMIDDSRQRSLCNRYFAAAMKSTE